MQGSTTSKLKGTVYSHDIPGIGSRIWDTADYVVPPQLNNAFFVTTNVIVTPNQKQGKCPESDKFDVKCESDADCPEGEAVNNGNGVRTGKCVRNEKNESVCEIYAWCPVEKDKLLMWVAAV